MSPLTTLVLASTVLGSRAASGAAAPKPHILFILVDDLGYAELSYHRREANDTTREVQTPSIDALVASGVQLERHYVHKFCSPTRCAIQSGRAPVHVNVINAAPSVHNPNDTVAGYAAMPRNMTGIAEVLRGAGYKTHFAGKWDVGMATPDHTPAGRGYDSGLGYYHHSNDYWTFKDTDGKPKASMKDLWNFEPNVTDYPGRPAKAKLNSPTCTQDHQKPTTAEELDDWVCVYEDTIFEERVKTTIRNHNPEKPLFMFWATHIVHGPLQVPDEQFAKFSFIDNVGRQKYHSMVNFIDGAIGRVVDKLKDKGMYDNTLVVFTSDNGGPLPGANNYPLKGGKFSNWEGGIRSAAFVSGGFLPDSVRGTISDGLVGAWDWYATFAALAGADPTDNKASAAGLPPIDSLNVWPLVSGQNTTSPRSRVVIGSNTDGNGGRTSGNTTIGGIIRPPYKIIIGYDVNNTINMAGWPGLKTPNNTASPDWDNLVESCGRTPETGCLYNIYEDPTEHNNIAATNPDIFQQMLAEVDEAQKQVFSPERGIADGLAVKVANEAYDGFWGPFLDIQQ